MSETEIRPAKPDELGTVESLLLEAGRWLASRGIDQWQFPPHVDRVQRAIENGECFLAVQAGEVIGTITVDDHADPEFWTEDDEPDAALYVHRMAVRRKAAGSGVGAEMLDWASKRAAQQGKAWLRLDAWKTNEGLHRYYEGQGFRMLRTVDLEHRGSGALFERAA